ncbi:hypothetical protein [Aquicoccus sp.]|uniref:hypothetical protein n=1 Tax=Aquicoccus sp. TaxID=2055851 RepID=UPI003567B3CC
MKQIIMCIGSMLVVMGCAEITQPEQEVVPSASDAAEQRPVARPTDATIRPPRGGRTIGQLDTTSAEEKRAAGDAGRAAQAGGAGRSLGRTIASLGDPARPGLWIETPLVSAPGRGRVVYPRNGKAVELDLIPIKGPRTAGSRMSLAALRVIEAPLTDLPEVEVYSE